MNIEKGQMITFSEGEYSDYCVKGLVVALKQFNLKERQEEWEKDNTETADHPYLTRKAKKVSGTAFCPWLVMAGLVEDIDYIEIYTGFHDISEIEINLNHNIKTNKG